MVIILKTLIETIQCFDLLVIECNASWWQIPIVFLGCYEDDFLNRAMNVSISISDDDLTPTLCKSKCKDEGERKW